MASIAAHARSGQEFIDEAMLHRHVENDFEVGFGRGRRPTRPAMADSASVAFKAASETSAQKVHVDAMLHEPRPRSQVMSCGGSVGDASAFAREMGRGTCCPTSTRRFHLMPWLESNASVGMIRVRAFFQMIVPTSGPAQN